MTREITKSMQTYMLPINIVNNNLNTRTLNLIFKGVASLTMTTKKQTLNNIKCSMFF